MGRDPAVMDVMGFLRRSGSKRRRSEEWLPAQIIDADQDGRPTQGHRVTGSPVHPKKLIRSLWISWLCQSWSCSKSM
jgi:hypothetical protein